MNFTEEFHKITNDRYSFLKEHSVTVRKAAETVELVFLVPYDLEENAFTQADKEAVEKAVRFLIPERFKILIKYTKKTATNEQLKGAVIDFLGKSVFSSFVHQMSEGDIAAEVGGSDFCVNIRLYSHLYDYAEKFGFKDKLERHLDASFSGACTVNVEDKGEAPVEGVGEFKEPALINDRHIVTHNHEIIIGRAINAMPSFIADAKEPQQSVTLCGRIGGLSERAAKTGNLYYSFHINDTTGRVTVKYFTNSPTRSMFEGIEDGQEVIIEGNLDFDKYSKEMTLYLKRMSWCKIDWASIIIDEDYNEDLGYYRFVKPQPYTDSVQQDFFGAGAGASAPEYLKGKTFIVYDFETTGIDPSRDMITELAAVKLQNGEITETFSSFVNPEVPIPSEVVKITGITDEMVKDAPVIAEVFPDFHKFLGDAVLVGHNIEGFDMLFLKRFAKQFNYKCINESKDTLILARKYIKDAPGYSLGKLCAFVGIEFSGAHRAINDVAANAEFFRYLAKFMV